MRKNRLLVALTFAFIPIPLIWSTATKSVNAEAFIAQTLQTQESNVEVDDEALELKKDPAPNVDTLAIPEIPITNPSLETQVETESLTTKKTHTYPKKSDTTAGAEATCSLISWNTLGFVRDDAAQITCKIKDTGNDGNSVYVKWWLDGYGDVRLTNSNGYRNEVTKTDARRNPSSIIKNVYWQVCRDVPFWKDNCDEDPQVWTIK